MPATRRTVKQVAEEVKQLHDIDEALSKTRVKTKIEQRDVRLKIGSLVNGMAPVELAIVARESGYTVLRLKDFAAVRVAWPNGSFPKDLSYTPLEELKAHPDRFDLVKAGMSKRDARAAKGGKVDTPSRWSPETKAAFIAESMADPEVARHVVEDLPTRAALGSAEADMFRESRERQDLDPAAKAMRQTVSGGDIVRRLTTARYIVNRSLDQAMDEGLTDAKRQEAVAACDELMTSVEWARSFFTSGDTSFEQALEDILRTEGN